MCLLIVGAAESLSPEAAARLRKDAAKTRLRKFSFPLVGFLANVPGDCLPFGQHGGASLGFLFCCHPAVAW